jgi:hypothetical protein
MAAVDQARAALLASATDKAAEAIKKVVVVSDSGARKAAAEALKAGGLNIRTEYLTRLVDDDEMIMSAVISFGVAAVDLAMLVTAFIAGGPRTRIAAALAAAGHVGIVVLSQRRQRQIVGAVNDALDRSSGGKACT